MATKKISRRDFRETGVHLEPLVYTLTVKTFKGGTVQVQCSPYELAALGSQIAEALKRERAEAERIVQNHADAVRITLKPEGT